MWNPDPWPAPQNFEITLADAIQFDGIIARGRVTPFVQKAIERANERIGAKSFNCPLVVSVTVVPGNVVPGNVVPGNVPGNSTGNVPGSVTVDTTLDTSTDESYKMSVDTSRLVEIQAKSVFGVGRALSTLTQFVVNGQVRACVVVDHPAFSHRGIMLDTARHFFSVGSIVKLLGAMEVVKLNRLHLHLWDSQAWPLAWADPAVQGNQLFQVGAHSPKSVYTKQDLHLIMHEAAMRGIVIIPEFELIAHNDILVLTYPEITSCNPNPLKPSGQINPYSPATYAWISRFLHWALDEVFVTQSCDGITYGCPLIHIGGDEVHKWCWETVAPNNTPYNFKQIMSTLLTHIFKEISARGRQIIAWSDLIRKDECDLSSIVPKNVLIQSWRDETHIQEVLDLQYSVIASPASPYYFSAGSWVNPGTGSVSMTAAYSFRLPMSNQSIQSPRAGSAKVIGGECCIWSEETHEAILDKVAWPRCGAIAERLWTNGETANYLSENRVNVLNSWLKQVGVDAWDAATVMQ